MNDVLIANILTIIGQGFTFYSSTRKEKRAILWFQIVAMLFMSTGSLILKGYSANVMDAIAITRNLMSIYSFSFPGQTYVFIAIAVIFGSLFNNIGILGYLPILANVVQSIVVLNKKTTARQLQFMFAFVSLCWAVYNFVIKAYAGAVFDAINMLSFLFNGITNKTKDTKESA
ncbi:MAG: YgjV family protein [Erysipelotrichaceae bacterium]|nr:YgjV family protein [Erysipelotrichaceae bacterium]